MFLRLILPKYLAINHCELRGGRRTESHILFILKIDGIKQTFDYQLKVENRLWCTHIGRLRLLIFCWHVIRTYFDRNPFHSHF